MPRSWCISWRQSSLVVPVEVASEVVGGRELCWCWCWWWWWGNAVLLAQSPPTSSPTAELPPATPQSSAGLTKAWRGGPQEAVIIRLDRQDLGGVSSMVGRSVAGGSRDVVRSWLASTQLPVEATQAQASACHTSPLFVFLPVQTIRKNKRQSSIALS